MHKKSPEFHNFGEYLYYAYANLQRLHYALKADKPKYDRMYNRGTLIIPQGEYVAESLKTYLENHPQIEQRCSKNGEVQYLTTENPEKFKEQAQIFIHESVEVGKITLER